MKKQLKLFFSIPLSLSLCILASLILTLYLKPMEDLSLNLSLTPEGEAVVADNFEELVETYDHKGWTVYTADGDSRTELMPNYVGDYAGAEPGQTFYFSRILSEKLDSPILRLSAYDRTFSVFLDEELLYTDWPDQDNRIGYLTLPMNDWVREDDITLSLPADYYGRTLTIAQSMPEVSEASTLLATPCDVFLYCGYAYESELIAESFGTALLACTAFIAGCLLLILFLRQQDIGSLFLSVMMFLYMVHTISETSFFLTYFGNFWYNLATLCYPAIPLMLLFFLVSRAGKYKKLVRVIFCLHLSLYIFTGIYTLLILNGSLTNFSFMSLAQDCSGDWISFTGYLLILVLGFFVWRKETLFYRIFTPLALAANGFYWLFLFLTDTASIKIHLFNSPLSGQITYIYYRFHIICMVSALITVFLEAIHKELEHRTEKRLLEDRRLLTLESYRNLRHQQEEILMLRHDMKKHFSALRSMSDPAQITDYLDHLIDQTQKIHPVIQSGNEMLDIILNGKLTTAMDAGIKVKVIRAQAPKHLPVRDADLCSLIMNIIDNAVAAASVTDLEPYIHIDIHVKNNYLSFTCENSSIGSGKSQTEKKVPRRHGLGLKIIQSVTERYHGLLYTEFLEHCYRLHVALPLFQLDK